MKLLELFEDHNHWNVPAYHGSPWPDFDEFKAGERHNTANETRGLGFWFTNNPETASNFAQKDRIEYEPHPTKKWEDGSPMVFARDVTDVGGVFPVQLKLHNPMIFSPQDGRDSFDVFMSFRDRWVRYIDGVHGREGHWRKRMIAMNPDEANEEFRAYLTSKGYDGIIIRDTEYDAPKGQTIDQYCVFRSNQIRGRFAKKDLSKKDSPKIMDSVSETISR